MHDVAVMVAEHKLRSHLKPGSDLHKTLESHLSKNTLETGQRVLLAALDDKKLALKKAQQALDDPYGTYSQHRDGIMKFIRDSDYVRGINAKRNEELFKDVLGDWASENSMKKGKELAVRAFDDPQAALQTAQAVFNDPHKALTENQEAVTDFLRKTDLTSRLKDQLKHGSKLHSVVGRYASVNSMAVAKNAVLSVVHDPYAAVNKLREVTAGLRNDPIKTVALHGAGAASILANSGIAGRVKRYVKESVPENVMVATRNALDAADQHMAEGGLLHSAVSKYVAPHNIAMTRNAVKSFRSWFNKNRK